MNKRLTKLVQNSDSRYLTPEEQEEILSYTESLPARFRVAAMVAEKEQFAVRHCIDEMRKLYPNFERHHDQAWQKAYRDVQLATRYAVQAMVLDDTAMLEEKLLYWLRTILASFGFTPKFVHDTYRLLAEGMQKNLPEEAYAMMKPVLDRIIDVLSQFPEPVTPTV